MNVSLVESDWFAMALIKTVNGMTPNWGENCYFSETAAIIGAVNMGDDCSIWFNAVLRADVDTITLGNRVNVQDGSCIHETNGIPVIIGDDVTIGHNVTVHGAIVHHGALIGMGSTLLDHSEVGEGAIVAAGALVLQGTKIPAYEIWAGVPAKFVKKAAAGQAETNARHYLDMKEWYTE